MTEKSPCAWMLLRPADYKGLESLTDNKEHLPGKGILGRSTKVSERHGRFLCSFSMLSAYEGRFIRSGPQVGAGALD